MVPCNNDDYIYIYISGEAGGVSQSRAIRRPSFFYIYRVVCNYAAPCLYCQQSECSLYRVGMRQPATSALYTPHTATLVRHTVMVPLSLPACVSHQCRHDSGNRHHILRTPPHWLLTPSAPSDFTGNIAGTTQPAVYLALVYS